MKKSFLVILLLVILVSISLLVLEDRSRTKKVIQPEKQISGGIVPHDFSVESMNIELIKKLALQKPKLIILLGPNHFENGNNKITVFDQDWKVSDYGIVKTNRELVDSLIRSNLVGVNNDIFEKEYSIRNNLVYIHVYLPEVKAIPIIFKKNCSLEEVKTFSEYLAAKIDKNTVVLATVDFSHYLSSSEAKEMDAVTLDEMKKLNYNEILRFDSKNLDSPASVATLLMIMQKLNKTKMEILSYKNSSEIKKSQLPPTTSYFSIIFH